MSIIYTDNLCDLSKEELKKYKVEQISFPLTFFAETYKNFDNFDYENFDRAIKENSEVNIIPISKQEYIDAFEPALQAGQDIIYIHTSAKLFSTTSTLNEAILELNNNYSNNKINVVDSYTISISEGMIVKEVARKNIEGSTHEELVEYAKDLRKIISSVYMIDSIKNLKAFNKIDNDKELGGSILGIKPIISFDEFGKISIIGKANGRKKGVLQLTEILQQNGKNLLDYYIEIVYLNCLNEAELLRDNIANIIGTDTNILIKKCNPIVSFFAGNSILGVSFHK